MEGLKNYEKQENSSFSCLVGEVSLRKEGPLEEGKGLLLHSPLFIQAFLHKRVNLLHHGVYF